MLEKSKQNIFILNNQASKHGRWKEITCESAATTSNLSLQDDDEEKKMPASDQ